MSFEAFGDGEAIIKASVIADTFSVSEGWNLRIPGLGEKPAGGNADLGNQAESGRV